MIYFKLFLLCLTLWRVDYSEIGIFLTFYDYIYSSVIYRRDFFMSLARLNKVKKYYGDKLILDIDKLEILDRDRIGLVGVNGAGKNTLIKSLLGQIPIDEGNVSLTKSFK